MWWFCFKVILAVVFVVIGRVLLSKGSSLSKDSRDVWPMKMAGYALNIFAIPLLLWAIIGTSVVWVPAGSIATMNRVYLGSSLPPGRIVALDGELGPQARIMTPGFHMEFLVTLTHTMDFEEMFNVPPGSCAIMSAKDGLPAPGGAAFAAPWTDAERQAMANNATHFMTEGKGQRGPQTSVLTPGLYTINPYLWEKPEIIKATRIEQGTVGVVKSSVRASVDFGSFKRELAKNSELRVLNDLPIGRAKALLVPTGDIGVWEEALPNGFYYINTSAYKITMVPTIAQVFEYKGGYTRRSVDVTVDDAGKITEKVVEKEVQPVPESADTAISAKPEGWDVHQELRVLAQISPELAPFVAAAIGIKDDQQSKQIIEDRVVTPIIRSVVRDVLGGTQIAFKQQKAVLDADGSPITDPTTGEMKTQMAHEYRSVEVMDLLENRPSLEEAMEQRAKDQAEKEGVTIMEVLLADSAIPAELLIARKRAQLAEQMTKSYMQEKIAQDARKETEKARATAEQQTELVKADILAQAAEKRAEARETEGNGEMAYLTAIAEGQKAQADVLGPEVTARLQMFNQVVKAATELIEKNPNLLSTAVSNAQKFVPQVVVNSSGGSEGNLEGAAAIFGHLLGGQGSQAPWFPRKPQTEPVAAQ